MYMPVMLRVRASDSHLLFSVMCICPPAYPRSTFPTLVALGWRNLFQVRASKACSKGMLQII